ncbi:hypothetical protein VNO78_22228 [Psophocarpus tetragonolobus]|uniref:t-SNARE coiled-coil homology domain-containing protein n=1 Tax=Psophocarpus tetragonolobus TaxID=3891 RepID=A0AAN9SEK2_PSOTE
MDEYFSIARNPQISYTLVCFSDLNQINFPNVFSPQQHLAIVLNHQILAQSSTLFRGYELPKTTSFAAPHELVPTRDVNFNSGLSSCLRTVQDFDLVALILLYINSYYCLILKYRDNRSSRSSLVDGFDSLEEGGLRASSSYSREINEHDNDKAIESLQDKVSFLKRLTGDIHEEVESHNQLLDRVGNKMDGSRGMMMGTMDRFKKVFEKKSARKTCSLVAYFIGAFVFIYYLIRMLGYFTLG